MDNTVTVGETSQDTRYIALAQIDIPESARPHTPEDQESLAQDMAKVGQLQEIVVAAKGDRYEVVAGVGRTLAARKLGWEKIRCLIKEGLSDFEKARITYAENEEREDADPFYQAAQLQKMMKAKGWTQDELASEIGQAESNVKVYLALLKVSPEFQTGARRLALSISQLREILRLENDQDRIKLAQETHDKDLSVRALKALVDKQLNKAPKAEKSTKEQAAHPVFNAGGQSFTFAQKGKHFTMVTEPPSMDMLDVFMQNTRCAVIDYLNAPKPQATPDHPPTDTEVAEKVAEPVKEAASVAA